MLKLTHRYAGSLLEYAEEQGLEKVYSQVLSYLDGKNQQSDDIPSELKAFLDIAPGDTKELKSILTKFVRLAREKMGIIVTEIVTAQPLSENQLQELGSRLEAITKKRLEISTHIDPSLLGGVKVILGDTIIDDSIKSKLGDMKKSIYDKVYSYHGI